MLELNGKQNRAAIERGELESERRYDRKRKVIFSPVRRSHKKNGDDGNISLQSHRLCLRVTFCSSSAHGVDTSSQLSLSLSWHFRKKTRASLSPKEGEIDKLGKRGTAFAVSTSSFYRPRQTLGEKKGNGTKRNENALVHGRLRQRHLHNRCRRAGLAALEADPGGAGREGDDGERGRREGPWRRRVQAAQGRARDAAGGAPRGAGLRRGPPGAGHLAE